MRSRPAALSATNTSPPGATRSVRGCCRPAANCSTSKPGGTCRCGAGRSLHHRRRAMRRCGEVRRRHRIRCDVPHDSRRIVVPVAVCRTAGQRLTGMRDGCRRQQQQCGIHAGGQSVFPVVASGAKQSPARYALRWRLPRRYAPNKNRGFAPSSWRGLRPAIHVFLWSPIARRGWPAFAGHDDGARPRFRSRAGRARTAVSSNSQ